MIDLHDQYNIHILWDNQSWYLVESQTNNILFSFYLPSELFNLYAEDGRLTESRALDLKSEMLSQFQAVIKIGETTRLITFILDRDWIQAVRKRIAELPRRNNVEFNPDER